MSMPKVTLAISAIVFVALTVAIWATQVSSWHVIGGSDNAFLAECLENINERGLPYTSVNRASHRYIALVNDFDGFERFADAVTPPPPDEINQFHRHSYVALYTLAPFARFFDPALVLTAAKAVSLVLVVALGFVMLLRSTGRPWYPLAFAALLVAHPFFTHSLGWQVYVDFLFLPVGFLLCRGLRDRPGARSTVLWAFACCLVCEKFIFVTALLTATFALLYHAGRTRKRMLLTAGGLVVLFLIVSRTARWIEPESTVRPHYDYGNWLQILLSPASIRNSITLLFVSFGVYVPLLLRDRRLLLLLLVALMPNLLGSVGGAEKIGWSTHYHVTYFPVLAFVLFESLRLRSDASGRGSTVGFTFAMLLATCHPLLADVTNVTAGPDTSTSSQWFPMQAITLAQRHAAATPTLEALRALEHEIPDDVVVSTSGNLSTTLYPHRTLDFFPIGVERADVLVLHGNDCRRDGDGYDFVMPAFSPDAETNRRFDAFVTERAAARFDLEHPATFGAWLLFRRRD